MYSLAKFAYSRGGLSLVMTAYNPAYLTLVFKHILYSYLNLRNRVKALFWRIRLSHTDIYSKKIASSFANTAPSYSTKFDTIIFCSTVRSKCTPIKFPFTTLQPQRAIRVAYCTILRVLYTRKSLYCIRIKLCAQEGVVYSRFLRARDIHAARAKKRTSRVPTINAMINFESCNVLVQKFVLHNVCAFCTEVPLLIFRVHLAYHKYRIESVGTIFSFPTRKIRNESLNFKIRTTSW